MNFKAVLFVLTIWLAIAAAVDTDDFDDDDALSDDTPSDDVPSDDGPGDSQAGQTFMIRDAEHPQLDPSNCQFQEIKKCNKKFKDVFQQASGSAPTHGPAKYARYCKGLQIFIKCLEDSSCTGPFIGNYSYVVLQHGMMDKKLSVCPNHHFNKLKNKVKAINAKHKFIDGIRSDEGNNCSFRVHKSCVDLFTRSMETNTNMCQDVEKFITCYEVSSTFCRAKVTQRFARLCAKLGEQMLKANEIHRGMMC